MIVLAFLKRGDLMEESMEGLIKQAIQDRRYLHQNPEVSWEEYKTGEFIYERLKSLNIEIIDIERPSVVGFLPGTKGDQTIALRADMDALPVQEEGNKAYISQNSGVAHVCGHDGHMAILLAVAEYLANNRTKIKPNVKFIFQTSEEFIPSGAEHLVKLGVLDDVDAVFGIHLWQGLAKGTIGLSHGPMMASADDFEITIEGKGGHGSSPQDAVDPIYIASFVIQALQAIVSRQTDAAEPKVITVAEIKSGSTFNIIPSRAFLRGTVRAFSPDMITFIKQQMEHIIKGISETFDAQGSLHYIDGTPPLINDHQMSKYAEQVIRKSFGETHQIEIVKPLMGGEDFSHYLLNKPGAFVFIGMGGEKSAYPHHHPKFDIDEGVFPTAIKYFISLVKNFY